MAHQVPARVLTSKNTKVRSLAAYESVHAWRIQTGAIDELTQSTLDEMTSPCFSQPVTVMKATQ